MTNLEEMQRNADEMRANAARMRKRADTMGWLAIALFVCAGAQVVIAIVRVALILGGGG